VRQHVDLGNRGAGRDRDLLDHVAQAAQLRVGGVLRHQHATQLARDHATAAAQADHPERGRQHDRDERHQAGHDQDPGQLGRGFHGAAERQRGGEVDHRDDADDGDGEEDDEPGGHPADLALALEEVHRGTSD
jgi:hypothetical protein